MRNSADQDLIEAIVRRGVEVGVRTAMAQIRSDLAGVSKRQPIVPPSMDSQPQIEQSLECLKLEKLRTTNTAIRSSVQIFSERVG